MRSASLNRARRARELDGLAGGRVVDVLVVGGGITGVGVALDAASRGLSTALVERGDLASGTSRWSSKLVHGGLRYLGQLDVPLAMESARERGILMETTAPHLVDPIPFLVPLAGTVGRPLSAMVRAGTAVTNTLRAVAGTDRATLPAPRRISAAEARLLAPDLDRSGLRGGLLFWEGRLVDDARLVIAVARTAAAHGASVLTYCEAEQVGGDGAVVHDHVGDTRFTLRARNVISATGVWAGQFSDDIQLQPSRGSHLLVDADRLGNPRAAVSVPVPGHTTRFVFAIPRPDSTVLVGLTDDPVDGPVPDVAHAEAHDVRFLLRTINQALEAPLTEDDVIGTFAGLRPLLRGSDGQPTADLSRRHRVLEDADDVIHVIGGKLTTYRKMAVDAVDRLAARPGMHVPASGTAELPLVGAADPETLDSLAADVAAMDTAAATIAAGERLVSRYGTEAPLVAAFGQTDPKLRGPVVPRAPTLGVELAHGLRHEGAVTTDDLLDRRTRLGLVDEWREAAEPLARELLATRISDGKPHAA